MNIDRPVPTRRGTAVAVVATVGFGMGHWFGGRGLNAVVMPAVTILVIGLIQVARADVPRVRRRHPGRGHVGDTVFVQLSIEGDTAVPTRLEDLLPDAIHGDSTFEAFADGRTLRYDATLGDRGVYELGPVGVELTDLFGLWRRREIAGDAREIEIYPPVRSLHESADLLSGYVGLTDQREQFDTIREYERGDALRDVNWKASAKRAGDLVVTEYAGEGAENRVIVGLNAPPSLEDEGAEAAASVAIHLLDHGLRVGLVTPTEYISPATGEDQRRLILSALARYHGEIHETEDFPVSPDLTVQAGPAGIHLSVADDSQRFDEMVVADRGRAA